MNLLDRNHEMCTGSGKGEISPRTHVTYLSCQIVINNNDAEGTPESPELVELTNAAIIVS